MTINDPSFITVVSGFTRSGTSLMMQMLAAGGMELFADDFRKPDARNPRGYFEHERALKLGEVGETTAWVGEARGKAVKVIATQIEFLPSDFEYRVIFMRRSIAEIIASIGRVASAGVPPARTERERVLAFKAEYVLLEAWLKRQRNMKDLFVSYNQLLSGPASPIQEIIKFLGLPLDAEKMRMAIDPSLYRHRIV